MSASLHRELAVHAVAQLAAGVEELDFDRAGGLSEPARDVFDGGIAVVAHPDGFAEMAGQRLEAAAKRPDALFVELGARLELGFEHAADDDLEVLLAAAAFAPHLAELAQEDEAGDRAEPGEEAGAGLVAVDLS